MFHIFTLFLVCAFIHKSTKDGPREGFWEAWWLSAMLLPVWLDIQIGSLKLDLRSVGAVLGLGAILLAPSVKPKGFFRPTLSDLIILVMVAGQIISEKTVGKFGPLTGPELARIWLLPYVVGRVFLGSESDITRVLPSFARMGLVLTVYSMVESVLKFNPLNRILGKTYGLLEQGEGYRMGLKRCQAGLDHPIFYGMMMILLLPWALEVGREAKRSSRPKYWKYLGWLWAGALIGSVSRGPQLCGLATTGISVFFNKPRRRAAILGFALVGGVGVYAAKAIVMQLSATISGEAGEEARIIFIDGEEEEYTGTKHRILLFKVYRDAIEKAGWFGHGYQMQSIQLEESLAQRFGSIDSAFILIFLQRGWLGLGSFLLLLLNSLVMLARMAWCAQGVRASLSGSIFGAMVTVSLGLFSVWFAPDFGTIWLFTAGLAANLWVLPHDRELKFEPRTEGDRKLDPIVKTTLTPRLATGAAPVRRSSGGDLSAKYHKPAS